MEKYLSEICNVQYGFPFNSTKFSNSEGTPLIRIRDINRGYSETYTTEEYQEEYLVNPDDLLIGMDGEFNIAKWGQVPALLNQRVCRLIPKDEIEKDYLLYYLSKVLKTIEVQTPFVTVKHLSAKEINKILVPIPTIEKQKKITAIINETYNLISLRKQQLAKLDQLIKSQFIEMFGDPVTNPMGWKQMTFKQGSIRLSDGPFGSNLKSEHYAPTGVRVIRLQNIGAGVFADDDKVYVSKSHYEKIKKYTCKSGEIVIGTLGEPNFRACIIPKSIEYAINKADCVHYQPKPELLANEFVCHYINCPATQMLVAGMIHGQTRARISSGQIAEMQLFVPPINLQDQFADFVKQTDKSKSEIQKSLEKLETLKKALMQQYFG